MAEPLMNFGSVKNPHYHTFAKLGAEPSPSVLLAHLKCMHDPLPAS